MAIGVTVRPFSSLPRFKPIKREAEDVEKEKELPRIAQSGFRFQGASSLRSNSLFKHDKIAQLPLFADRDPRFVGQLLQDIGVEVFQPGDTILCEGDSGDSMYLLNRGGVEVVVGDKVVATLRDGSVFGEMLLLGLSSKRSATVRALTFCDCRVIRREWLLRLFALFPHERVFYENEARRRYEELQAQEAPKPKPKDEPSKRKRPRRASSAEESCPPITSPRSPTTPISPPSSRSASSRRSSCESHISHCSMASAPAKVQEGRPPVPRRQVLQKPSEPETRSRKSRPSSHGPSESFNNVRSRPTTPQQRSQSSNSMRCFLSSQAMVEGDDARDGAYECPASPGTRSPRSVMAPPLHAISDSISRLRSASPEVVLRSNEPMDEPREGRTERKIQRPVMEKAHPYPRSRRKSTYCSS